MKHYFKWMSKAFTIVTVVFGFLLFMNKREIAMLDFIFCIGTIVGIFFVWKFIYRFLNTTIVSIEIEGIR